MIGASSDELTMLATELNIAWAAYTDVTDVAPEDTKEERERLAKVILGLWKAGVKEGLAQASLNVFTKQAAEPKQAR